MAEFTQQEAGLILDLTEQQSAGTPQESQIADATRDSLSELNTWPKIEKAGGLEKAAELCAKDYPDLV